MSEYDDMRDMQRREENPDYVTPTFAYTGADFDELVHDCGGDEDHANEIMLEVMDRDKARYDGEVAARLQARITYLENVLDDNGLEY